MTMLHALKRAAAAILFALCKLNEIQFDAPWERRGSRCSGL
jgi:hypothetical protein